MNGGKLVVESLKRHKVEFVFGLVDTTILDILDALASEPSIRYVSVRHEQVAAMMADGYARVARRPGVCLTQCGAGAMNLLYGVASAFRDSIPLVAITGNVDSGMIGRDVWHDIDTTSLYTPVTKLSTCVTRADQIAETLDNAFDLAMSGRPGPVHVSVPKDVQAQVIASAERARGKPAAAATLAFDGSTLQQIVEALAKAERPVIFAGAGVIWADASAALLRFSELADIPVIVTDTARGAIPERHPNALGPSGFFGSVAAGDALKAADVIMGVGTRFPDVNTGGWKLISPTATVIQNNIDAGEIGKRVPVTFGVAADARVFLEGLEMTWRQLGLSAPAGRTARNADRKRAVESERVAAMTPGTAQGDRIPIGAVVSEIALALNDEMIIAFDGGAHAIASSRLQINRGGALVQSSGLGAMGYAMPAAMGAKLANPERQALALVGDGGFAMVSQDLETAVRCDIPIVVVVYNNNAFGAQRVRQQRDYGGRMIGTQHGNPDFGELAKLYGAEGRTVRRIEEFRPALEDLLKRQRVGVIDVHIQ